MRACISSVRLLGLVCGVLVGGCSPGTSDTGSQLTLDTGGSEGTGEEGGREVCERYLGCVAKVAPAALPGLQMGFSEDGTCWQGSDEDAQRCLAACRAGIDMYSEFFPEQETCRCQSNSDCAEAGELCYMGQCTVTTCGDGIVDAMDVCDGQPGCDEDCMGPARCNPLANFGCPAYGCTIQHEDGVNTAQCQGYTVAEEGAPCGQANRCKLKLGCASPELLPACDPKGLDGCCARLCQRGEPAQCDEGEVCVPFMDGAGVPLAAELEYVGFCVPA